MKTETFETIVKNIRPKLLELSERFLAIQPLPEEAEDIVQETLFRLWKMREQLDAYEHPEALAITIAKNVCIDVLRKQRLKTQTLSDDNVEDARRTDQKIISYDTQMMIRKAFDGLPATQRKMLMMRSNGMTLDEISTICKTTKQSTKTLISSARRTLLELLRKGGQL